MSRCRRIVFVLGHLIDIRYSQTAIPSAILLAESSNFSDTWGIQIMEVASVACSISYFMMPVQVTYDLSQDPLEPIVQIPSDIDTDHPGLFIDRFPPIEFPKRLNMDADDADFMVGSYITKGMDDIMPDTFVQMMSLVANNVGSGISRQSRKNVLSGHHSLRLHRHSSC